MSAPSVIDPWPPSPGSLNVTGGAGHCPGTTCRNAIPLAPLSHHSRGGKPAIKASPLGITLDGVNLAQGVAAHASIRTGDGQVGRQKRQRKQKIANLTAIV